MDIRPIRTEADLTWALKEVEPYLASEPEPGTPEGDRFSVLVDLIKVYETKHHPIPAAAPVDVLKFVMEQRGYRQGDLAKLFGSHPRASEILSGARPLTLEMIGLLSREWRIPADLLVPQRATVTV